MRSRLRAQALVLTLVLLGSGCGRPPQQVAVTASQALEEVAARRHAFKGFEADAVLTVKHGNESITLPLAIEVSESLRVEVKGEISNFLLPFQGSFRLASDEESTLLYTDMGTYNLAAQPGAQPAVRAFLLSLGGGGDWLVWWLAERGCAVGDPSVCEGIEVRLEPHGRPPSIDLWELSDPARGGTFRARVEAYEPGTVLPRVVTGTLFPDEVTIRIEYSGRREPPGPAG
jgi:hypothetical protein